MLGAPKTEISVWRRLALGVVACLILWWLSQAARAQQSYTPRDAALGGNPYSQFGAPAFSPQDARSTNPVTAPPSALDKLAPASSNPIPDGRDRSPAHSVTAPQLPPGNPNLAVNEVDLQQSRVYVKTLHTGLGHSHGIEGKLASGVLRLSAAQGAGTLVFDMKSFQADTAEARKRVELKPKDDASTAAKVTAEMLGAAVLDTATHPTATFDVDSAQLLDRDKKTGELKYLISGMLTLRGVKRSVKIQVKGEPRGDFVRLTGNFPLLQSDFRIKPFSTMLGAMGVANQLTIYGDLLVRSPTPPVPPPAPAAAKAPAGRGKPPRKG